MCTPQPGRLLISVLRNSIAMRSMLTFEKTSRVSARAISSSSANSEPKHSSKTHRAHCPEAILR